MAASLYLVCTGSQLVGCMYQTHLTGDRRKMYAPAAAQGDRQRVASGARSLQRRFVRMAIPMRTALAILAQCARDRCRGKRSYDNAGMALAVFTSSSPIVSSCSFEM